MAPHQTNLSRALLILCILCTGCLGAGSRKFDSFFDVTRAKNSAALAFASYCPTQQILGWTCRFCNLQTIKPQSVMTNAGEGTLSYVAYDPSTHEALVIFRGTKNLMNVFEDLNAIHSDPSGQFGMGKVHSGFLEAYESLRNETLAELEKVLTNSALCPPPTGCGIHVVGHSLGGAMAVMAATEIAENRIGLKYSSLSLNTYGCPRVGDDEFAVWFGTVFTNHTTRMVHNHDIVPHLPPLLFDYHHYATEVWEEPESVTFKGDIAAMERMTAATSFTYKVCDGTGEDPNCSDSLPFYRFSVNDHIAYFGLPTASPFSPCGDGEEARAPKRKTPTVRVSLA